jgi:hypothetical protein
MIVTIIKYSYLSLTVFSHAITNLRFREVITNEIKKSHAAIHNSLSKRFTSRSSSPPNTNRSTRKQSAIQKIQNYPDDEISENVTARNSSEDEESH